MFSVETNSISFIGLAVDGRGIRLKLYILVLFIGTASSTTPLCTVTDGMASNTIIPSSEINVSDKTVAVDILNQLEKKSFSH
jgi:hypothetical protein